VGISTPFKKVFAEMPLWNTVSLKL